MRRERAAASSGPGGGVRAGPSAGPRPWGGGPGRREQEEGKLGTGSTAWDGGSAAPVTRGMNWAPGHSGTRGGGGREGVRLPAEKGSFFVYPNKATPRTS